MARAALGIAAVPGGEGDGDETAFLEADVDRTIGGRQRPRHDHAPGAVGISARGLQAGRGGIARNDIAKAAGVHQRSTFRCFGGAAGPAPDIDWVAGVAHAEIGLLDAARYGQRELHGDAVLAHVGIGDGLGIDVAGDGLGAVVPFEQDRQGLVVIGDAGADGVVGRREQALLGDDLGHQQECRRRDLCPARIVDRGRHATIDADRLDDRVLGPRHALGLDQGGDVIRHMPAILDAQALLVHGIVEGRHLGARNADGHAREDVARVVADAEGPGLGHIARPGALAAVVLELLDRVAAAVLAVALGATLGLVEQLAPAGDAFGRGRDLGAVVDLVGRLLLLEAGEDLDIGHQVPHLGVAQHVAPARHGGAGHAVADHAIEIDIVGHVVVEAGGPELVGALAEVARRRVEALGPRPGAVAVLAVTADAALEIDRLAIVRVALLGQRRRCRKRQDQDQYPAGPTHGPMTAAHGRCSRRGTE